MEVPDRLSGRCSPQFGGPALAGPGSGSEVLSQKGWEATPLPLGMFYSMAAGGKSRAAQTQESLMSDLAQATQGLSSHLHRHYFTKPLGFFLTGSHRQVAGSRGRLRPRAAFRRSEGHRAGVEGRGGAEPPDFSLLRQKPRLSSHK